ncbi:hypothetical protein EC844_10736 [Acinetobacter calcoaceticus]|uniref:Uncharacterized protein n=1 Tax=Acinetobacter calcoaceticus TaxID=471 RepID=A0A4R1XWT1_ACICA|nr:hypothetical protein EC844_10736 [Acinetobacter calcoaceticus]
MKIIKGTQYWRLCSVILVFVLLMSWYYFLVVYPKRTEQARIQWAEEIIQLSTWSNLVQQRQMNLSMLESDIPPNKTLDEIYIYQLNNLRTLRDFTANKSLKQITQSYSLVSGVNERSLDGLCLQLQFVQRYQQKIQHQAYTSARLKQTSTINQNNLNQLQVWLGELTILEQHLASINNHQFQAKCRGV